VVIAYILNFAGLSRDQLLKKNIVSWGEISLYGVRAGWLTILGDCDWDFDSKEFINCRCSESNLFPSE